MLETTEKLSSALDAVDWGERSGRDDALRFSLSSSVGPESLSPSSPSTPQTPSKDEAVTPPCPMPGPVPAPPPLTEGAMEPQTPPTAEPASEPGPVKEPTASATPRANGLRPVSPPLTEAAPEPKAPPAAEPAPAYVNELTAGATPRASSARPALPDPPRTALTPRAAPTEGAASLASPLPEASSNTAVQGVSVWQGTLHCWSTANRFAAQPLPNPFASTPDLGGVGGGGLRGG